MRTTRCARFGPGSPSAGGRVGSPRPPDWMKSCRLESASNRERRRRASGPGQLLVTGSVVNAAARLQTAALPGQVLAGSTAHTLTINKVSFGRRRRVRAKGFDEPIEAFPVEGLTTRSTRRTIPFVNRVSEQAILGQSLGLASTTGKPVLVTIVGEPGIGKSRLAEELAAGM